MRAARICPSQGCVNLIRGNQRLCSQCTKDTPRRYDDNRPPSSQRGYDIEWRKTRAAYLAENPFCVICGKQATDVDHKIPLRGGGTHDWDNLASYCKRCHSRKTAQYDGGFGNRKKKEKIGKGGQNPKKCKK